MIWVMKAECILGLLEPDQKLANIIAGTNVA